MGLYDHFTLVQQRTPLCLLNVVQLSTIHDPNIDTESSFLDPYDCPHSGIYQWTSYYTVPYNSMITDTDLHYVPDFRITYSTDTGNRIGCTVTGPIALRNIAAQKEREGFIAFGIALCIFVTIFGILLACSQYRKYRMMMVASRRSSSSIANHNKNAVHLTPRRNSTMSTTTSNTVMMMPPPPHPYPYYSHRSHRNPTSSFGGGAGGSPPTSPNNNNNSQCQYFRTLPNGQVIPVFGSSSSSLPPHRRFTTPHQPQHRNRNISTSVEEEGEGDDTFDAEEEDDDMNSDSPNRQTTTLLEPSILQRNPQYNETQLPSRPII
jgi:hypothetical protein